MKNKAILTSLLSLAAFNLFATHYRGGEITYKITSAYTVEATVTTYTKISGASIFADRDTITINWGDGTSNIMARINGPLDTTGHAGGVLIATDIKQNIYTGAHTYAGPPSNSNYYIISFYDANMLAGIANMADGNSVNIPIYVEDTIYMGNNYNSLPGGFDASPVFLNPPKYYANMSDTFTFNSAAYDPDGDSLSYALIPPKQDQNDAVPQYIFPDAYCNSIGSGSANTFQINSQTGEVVWITPCEEGFYQFAIEVREYRCGVFIGEVERNMQIIVMQYPIGPPQLSAVHDTIIEPGQLIEFNISSFDPGISDTDSIQVLGEPFLDSLNPPSFHGTTGNPASGVFSWQPDISLARPYSYLFTVISTNNYLVVGVPYPLADMETFRIWVEDTMAPCLLSAINNVPATDLQVNIFPNPADAEVHIQTSQQVSNIRVSDLSGHEVLNIKTNCTNCDLPVNELENGVYLLSITIGSLRITRKFIKIE